MKEKKYYEVMILSLNDVLTTTLSESPFPKTLWDMQLDTEVLSTIHAITPEGAAVIHIDKPHTFDDFEEVGCLLNPSEIETKADFVSACIDCDVDVTQELRTYDMDFNGYEKPVETIVDNINDYFSWLDLSSFLIVGGDTDNELYKNLAEENGVDFMTKSEFLDYYKEEREKDVLGANLFKL